MAELINLNKARKAKARTATKAEATANRAKFGRSKPEKAIAEAERAKRWRDLDGHKRED